MSLTCVFKFAARAGLRTRSGEPYYLGYLFGGLALRALTRHTEGSENIVWGEEYVGILTVGSDPPEHVFREAVVGGRRLFNPLRRGCRVIGPLETEGEWRHQSNRANAIIGRIKIFLFNDQIMMQIWLYDIAFTGLPVNATPGYKDAFRKKK